MAHSNMDVAKLCKKQRNISKRGLSAQYDNTLACQSFYNGDSMTYEDRIQFLDDAGRRRKARVNFNKVQENVDSVIGFMAQNRRQAKYIARVPDNEKQTVYSKNMNAIYDYHRENMNADQVETDQDADMLINGYGATETDLSYIVGNATTDPNGEILKLRLEPGRVYWDPNARARNLLDARWMGYSEDFELKEALELFQRSKEDDFEQVSDTSDGDTGYVYNPWGGLYDKIKLVDSVDWSSKEQDMVRVYNHQWMEYETFYRAKNPIYEAVTPEDAMFIKIKLDLVASQIKHNYPENIEAGDMFDFDPLAEELIFDGATKARLVKELGDLIDMVDFKRKCFYTAVVSGDHVFAYFKSICQQGFSIKFKTGVFNEQGKFWIGMVNAMMEPQKYYNKSLTELMFIIAATSKAGYLVEEDAVEDIADFESKIAKTNAVIKVAPGALSNGRILPKAQGAVPTGLENIITLSAQAISSAGVDPAFLGNSNDQETGVLFKRRIRQIISKMARYFDSITLYQKEDARLCGDLIRVWVQNNAGQWIRITGEQNADTFLQVSEDMMAPEYDVSIQEAPQTPEDKQETASMLGTMGDKLMLVNPQAGLAFYAEALQGIPLDGDVRGRLIQTLQPQQEQKIDPAYVQQLEQLVQQLQSENNQAEVEKKRADAAYAMARAQQTTVNNDLIRAKIPQTEAQTIKTMEEAARTAAEANLAEKARPEDTTVSI